MKKTVLSRLGVVFGLLILGQLSWEPSAEAGWKEKFASLFRFQSEALAPWKKPLLEGNVITHQRVRNILQRADFIHFEDQNGFNALLMASCEGDLQAVKLLIQAGADPNRPSMKSGLTPLMCASSQKSSAILQTLFAHGAAESILAQDKKHWTALMYAGRYGSLEVLQELFANGALASLHQKEEDGWNALSLVCRYGTAEMVNELMARGAEQDINEMNDEGATPLLHASLNEDHDEGLAIMAMIQKSPKFDFEPNIRGAVRIGNRDIAEDLVEMYQEEVLRAAQKQEASPKALFSEDCPICMQTQGVGGHTRFDGSKSSRRSVAIPSCGHSFCTNCLEKARERKNECSLCRKDLTDEDVVNVQFY